MIGAEGKYLRLISAGKMLNPDEAHVKDFGLTENCYVHCVVTAAPPRLHLPSLTPEQAEEEVRACVRLCEKKSGGGGVQFFFCSALLSTP